MSEKKKGKSGKWRGSKKKDKHLFIKACRGGESLAAVTSETAAADLPVPQVHQAASHDALKAAKLCHIDVRLTTPTESTDISMETISLRKERKQGPI